MGNFAKLGQRFCKGQQTEWRRPSHAPSTPAGSQKHSLQGHTEGRPAAQRRWWKQGLQQLREWSLSLLLEVEPAASVPSHTSAVGSLAALRRHSAQVCSLQEPLPEATRGLSFPHAVPAHSCRLVRKAGCWLPHFKCLECGQLLSHSAIPVAHGAGPLLRADSSAFGFFFEPPLMSRFAHSYKPSRLERSICSLSSLWKSKQTKTQTSPCARMLWDARKRWRAESAPPNPRGKVVGSLRSPGLGALHG